MTRELTLEIDNGIVRSSDIQTFRRPHKVEVVQPEVLERF